jgi:hypothetical protein
VGLAGEVAQYWQDVAQRVGDGLKASATAAQAGNYTADRFLEDVKAFWHALADDIDRGIDDWKHYIEHRGDGTP